MENNCRTLLVTYEYKETISGGIGRVINGIIPYLRAQCLVDVFHIKWKTKYMKLVSDHYTIENGKESCKNYFTLYRALIKVLESHQYDIIHILHVGVETTKVINIVKEKFPTIQVIFSCHSLAIQDYEIRKSNPKNIISEKVMIEKCDAVHLLNKTSEHLLKTNYPEITSTKPIYTIPNGIDKSEYIYNKNIFDRTKKNRKKEIIITCISRWSFGKGLEHFLNAVPLILENTKDVKFIIAGRKNISWEHKYWQYVRKIDGMAKKLKKHVKVMGWLDDKKRNKLFTESDICVMPSELEYFPYSLLEPMITNVPVVSSNIDCATELFSDQKECLFFENTNHKDLADKLIQLIANPEMRKSLSTNAYQRISTEFQWQHIGSQYCEMYSALTQNYKVPLVAQPVLSTI